jgi:hypothetical protein
MDPSHCWAAAILAGSRASYQAHEPLYWPRMPTAKLKSLFAMKKNLLWLTVLCSFAGAPSVAHGQKTLSLGVGGGASIPVGKLGDTQKTGYNAMAVLAIGVSDLPFGLRLDGMYSSLAHVSSSATPSTDLRVTAALGNLIFTFPGTTVKGYMIAGGGLYNSKTDTPGEKAQNNFGVNGGLGATFGFGPFAGFVESRYHSISRSVAKGGVYQFVPITAGFLF